jgi:hypothetical protein
MIIIAKFKTKERFGPPCAGKWFQTILFWVGPAAPAESLATRKYLFENSNDQPIQNGPYQKLLEVQMELRQAFANSCDK